MPEVVIQDCLEAYEIAREEIAANHPHLFDESDCYIRYLTTSQHRTAKGRDVLGSTHKLTALQRHFAAVGEDSGLKPDFLILLSAEAWGFLDNSQKHALVDRELEKITFLEDNKDGHFAIQPYDLEEFAVIVRRHGLWQPEHKVMARAMAVQIPLGLDDIDKPQLNEEKAQESVPHQGAEPFDEDGEPTTTVTFISADGRETAQNGNGPRLSKNGKPIGRPSKQAQAGLEGSESHRGVPGDVPGGDRENAFARLAAEARI